LPLALIGCLFLVLAFVFRKVSARRWFAGFIPVVFLFAGSGCGTHYAYSDSNEITFLLGEDRSDRNRYFACAKDYFSSDSLEKTPLTVSGCHTMTDVRNYLDLHRPRGGAWRRVNLVVHGNEWTGVNVPLTKDIPRTSTQSLETAIQSGAFRPLTDQVIDPWTEMVVYGCNVGRDSQLLYQLSAAFGGNQKLGPAVRSARYFNMFQKKQDGSGKIIRYLADCKTVPVKAGQFPGNKMIAKQLHDKYPTDTTNWTAALGRLKPRFPGDSYVHYFHIPAQWTTLQNPDDTYPVFQTAADTLQWVYAQTDLLKTIKTMGFSPEQFRWEITPSTYTPQGGKPQPAIITKGLTVIYGVLEPLQIKTAGQQAVPACPAVNDERYYTVVRKVSG
jgi:hypothetical protein